MVGASDPAFSAELGASANQSADQSEEALRRAVFPVTQTYAYLNHAGVGPTPAPVVWALRQATDALSRRGSLEMEARLTEVAARERFGRLINVPPESIAFTKNVSDGFVTIAQGLEWRPGDNIVTAACEFPSNVYPWLNLAEQGVEIRFAQGDGSRLPLAQLAALIDERTRLVSVSLVEFGTGMRNDVAAIARLAHQAGALCAVDGIQGLGVLRLDATAADLDFVSTGSVKWLMAGEHIGMLYVRPSILPKLRVARRGWKSFPTPFDFFNYGQPLREDAGRLEGGSNNWLSLVAVDAALALLESAGAEQIERRALGLADTLRAGLRAHGVEVVSPDASAERSQIVLFRWGVQDDAAAATALVERLASESQVVLSARNGLVRVSPHFYNTTGDFERLYAGLERLR
jgi:selenocysteine lyase/cysteine desulfurase